MKDVWAADVANDPSNNYELYLEILQNEQRKARLTRNQGGDLVLHIYGINLEVPAEWIMRLIADWLADEKKIEIKKAEFAKEEERAADTASKRSE